jgi:hypothetical protein
MSVATIVAFSIFTTAAIRIVIPGGRIRCPHPRVGNPAGMRFHPTDPLWIANGKLRALCNLESAACLTPQRS